MNYIGFNHQIIEKKMLNFYLVERFRYADAFFESILFHNGRFPLINQHKERIYNACKAFHFDDFEINIAFLLDLIARNKALDKTLRIRISLVRTNGENYQPKGSQCQVLIECKEVHSMFKAIETVGTFTEYNKAIHPFSSFKTANSLIYVMAKHHALKNMWQDVIIANDKKEWIESSSSNIYVVKNNKIYSPNTESGCVSGVCRAFIKNFFEINFVTFEPDFLDDIDELFFSNAVNLIQPVLFFKNKKLQTKTTEKLILKLKKHL